MVLSRVLRAWKRSRERSLGRRAAHRALDALFTRHAELLPRARLRRHHRHRCTVLEVDRDAGGGVARILFGIVRHPKAHPLAPRGEEVLELIEYRPAEGSLQNVGARNLTRRPVD